MRHRVFAGTQGFHVVETTDSHLADGSFGTAGDDGVGATLVDETVGLTYAVGTCGTSRYHGYVGALCVIGDGDIAASDVRYHLGDEERRDAAQAVLQLVGMLTLKDLYAADAATDGGTEAGGVDILAHAQATVLHSLCGCCQGVECVSVVVAYHRLVDAVVFRVEVLDFGSYLDGHGLAVELGDESDAAHAVDEVVPQRLDVVSQRGYTTHTCNIYFTHVVLIV